ncbi:MAG: hypothetical protein E6441_17380 [Clostridium sp.]|uniref:hypothetical protein n=1 Tax=Clostridium sp. TaxID=1506 RepID=UPI0029113246|nr:hypothetical protein [Clostridium sp.]MDU5211420.1 hypothetical protein [Clostridium sp.]MDU6763225.1 hypothetical protein [Clostridium sp.]
MKNKVLVHGVFLYKCEKCGCMEPMYLEKGVEGKNKEQPCPFTIRCPKCGELEMIHVMWGADNFFEPRELCENESYFALGERCGKPIFSKDV